MNWIKSVRTEVPHQNSWIQRAFDQIPAVQWAGRIIHGAKASEQRTLSVLAGLVEAAAKDAHPDLAHSARLMREGYAAEADWHRHIAKEKYGAMNGLQEVHKLSELGNVAITNALELSVPLATAALASRAGLPGLLVAGQVLNTAFNVDLQRQATGHTDISHAALVAVPQTALQLAGGSFFRNVNPLSWFTGGATLSVAQQDLQELSILGQPRIDDADTSVITRAIEGGLTGMVLGPLSSWSPRPALRSPASTQSAPRSVQFTGENPLQLTRSSSTQTQPIPHDASFSSMNARGISFLGTPINRTLHMPEPAGTEFSRAKSSTEPRITDPEVLELALRWGTGTRASSAQQSLIRAWEKNRRPFSHLGLKGYVELAETLWRTPPSSTVWRKETLIGGHITFDAQRNLLLLSDANGLPLNLIEPEGGLEGGKAKWEELTQKEPPLIPRTLDDMPAAIKALQGAAHAWLQKGITYKEVAERTLNLRKALEKHRQRLTGNEAGLSLQQANFKEPHAKTHGPTYDYLSQLRKAPDQIIQIALDPNSKYFTALPTDLANAAKNLFKPEGEKAHWAERLQTEPPTLPYALEDIPAAVKALQNVAYSWLEKGVWPKEVAEKILGLRSALEIRGQQLASHEAEAFLQQANGPTYADLHKSGHAPDQIIQIAIDPSSEHFAPLPSRLARATQTTPSITTGQQDYSRALQRLNSIAKILLQEPGADAAEVAIRIVDMRQLVEQTYQASLEPHDARKLQRVNEMIAGGFFGPSTTGFIRQQLKNPEAIIRYAVAEDSPFYARLDPKTQQIKLPYAIKSSSDYPIALNALAALAQNAPRQLGFADAELLLSMRRTLEAQLHDSLAPEIAAQLKAHNKKLSGHELGPDADYLRDKKALSTSKMILEATRPDSRFRANFADKDLLGQ